MKDIQKNLISSLGKPLYIIALIFTIYVSLFSLKAIYLKQTVYGDGRYYYAYLRSFVIDHDLNFSNEYAYFQIKEPDTNLGYKKNVYAIGPALFWLPTFTYIHSLLGGDGYSFLYQYFIGLTSVVYACIGLLFIYRILENKCKPIILSLTFIALALGTNLLFYGSLDTVNSHSLSFFVASVLLTTLIQKQRGFISGLVVGLLMLIRSQDIIFLTLLLPSISLLLPALAGVTLIFLPQLIVWQIMYGTFLTSPYLSPHHYFDFFHPQIANVLFSTQNGLILYTPLIIAGLIGLFLNKHPLIRIKSYSIIILFLIQLYIISSWSFWWQGESFSGRMFISTLPFITLGFLSFFKRIPLKLSILITFIGISFNLLSILFYLLTH